MKSSRERRHYIRSFGSARDLDSGQRHALGLPVQSGREIRAALLGLDATAAGARIVAAGLAYGADRRWRVERALDVGDVLGLVGLHADDAFDAVLVTEREDLFGALRGLDAYDRGVFLGPESLILRIGRVDEHQAPKVRIVLDGRPLDVSLAEGLATDPFFDAAKNEQVVSVRLRDSWHDRPALLSSIDRDGDKDE